MLEIPQDSSKLKMIWSYSAASEISGMLGSEDDLAAKVTQQRFMAIFGGHVCMVVAGDSLDNGDSLPIRFTTSTGGQGMLLGYLDSGATVLLCPRGLAVRKGIRWTKTCAAPMIQVEMHKARL